MKKLFGIFKTVFLLCGGVIGAGFLGGAELAEFFGAAGYLPFVAVSAVTFFIGFSFVFLREKQNGELTVSQSEQKITEIVFLAAELIFSAAMLAGVNEILREAGTGFFSYPLTFALFVSSCIFLKNGKRAAERLSSVAMPTALILVDIFLIIFLFGKKGMGVKTESVENIAAWQGIFKAVLFAALNVFITAPAVTETVKNKTLAELLVAAAVFSLIAFMQAVLILRTVETTDSLKAEVPVVRALAETGKIVRAIIFISLFFATFTSFFTCCAAASEYSEKKFGRKFKYASLIFTYLFSLAGLNKIVKYVYPIFGACGVFYVINSLIKFIKLNGKKSKNKKTVKSYRIKIRKKADNSNKVRFGGYKNV